MMQWGSRDDIRLRREFLNADASHKIYLNEKKMEGREFAAKNNRQSPGVPIEHSQDMCTD